MKKILSVLLVLTMVLALAACGGSAAPAATQAPAAPAATEAPAAPAATEAPAAELIKVGIINNDPNESGYRTANDADMKATFTEENGYLAKKRAEGKHYNVALSHAAKKLVRLIFAMEKSRRPYCLVA